MGIVKNAKPRLQPKHLVLPKLDKSNPIAKRGLYEGYIFHQQGAVGYDFAGKRNYSSSDDPAWTPEYVDFSTDKFIHVGERLCPDAMTIHAVVNAVPRAGWRCITANGNLHGWYLATKNFADGVYAWFRGVAVNDVGLVSQTGETAITMTASGGVVEVFINGISVGSSSGSFSAVTPQDTLIGAINLSSPRDEFNADMSCLYFFNEVLSDAEIKSLAAGRFQVVESKRSSLYFTPDAGGDVSVDIPTGSMTFTGLAPDVLTPVSVNIPAGALTLTGLAPVASVSVLANVPVGALSLTGFAPTVNATQNVNVDIPTGTLTLTGLVPQVVTPQSVDVPAGSLSLTGFAPAVNVSILTNVPTGTMTFTGLAPTVDITDSQLVDVPTGSMLFAGFAPTVELAGPVSVEVPAGSLTMSGFAPIILADSIVWTVQPDVTTTWNPQADSTTIWTEV